VLRLIAAFGAILLWVAPASAVVGLVWLLALGQWRTVLIGVAGTLAFQYVGALLMAVYKLPMIGAAGRAYDKGRRGLGLVLSFTSVGLDCLAGLAWSVMVIASMLVASKGRSPLPFLMLGWEVAVGPFLFWASKETPDNYAARVTPLFVGASYLACAFLGVIPFGLLASAVMLGGAIILLSRVVIGLREN
jgi:hypothetical protein